MVLNSEKKGVIEFTLRTLHAHMPPSRIIHPSEIRGCYTLFMTKRDKLCEGYVGDYEDAHVGQ